jgi:hypothetical protein
MRSHGRARVDPQNPEAFAVCDRCGFRRNHVDLTWQYQYRGNALTNIRVLVCADKCLDVPHEFARPVILPPDPVPITDPRPELATQTVLQNQYVRTIFGAKNLPTPPTGLPQFADDVDLATDGGVIIVTESGKGISGS